MIARQSFPLRLPVAIVYLLLLGVQIAFSGAAHAQTPDPTTRDFVVKYLSIDYVYLDGGKADGLRKGDRFMITRGDSLIAVLEIRYLSNTSASCFAVENNGQIFPHDTALLSSRGPEPETIESPSPPDSTTNAPLNTATAPSDNIAMRRTTRSSGTFSVQLYSWMDNSEYASDYLQTTLRLNLRARQIGGKALNFSVRTRGEYDNRSRSGSAAVAEEDWTNRIHELSLSYDDENAPFSFQLGRILPHRLSGAGYLDGALVDRRFSRSLRMGVFGGLRPRWQYREEASSLQKYGSYIAVVSGVRTGTYLEQTAAVSGEYHGSTVSRELLYFQGQLSVASRWSLSHILEIDYNRSWRREREASTLTISNLYLNARYRPNRVASFGISYDNRRNYWSYETLSVADSLFDDQLRSGLRGQVNLRLPGAIALFANYGYRKRSDETASTKSYSLSLSKTGLGIKGAGVNLRYAAFNGPGSNGANYGIRITQYIRGSNSVEVGYTQYRYTTAANDDTRRNKTLEAMTYISIKRHLFLIGSWQWERGDDTHGTGIRGEIGYRL